MGFGPNGGGSFGWHGSSASIGESGPGGNIKMFSGVCGQPGGPVAGQTTWIPAGDLLVGATGVDTIIVSKVIEQSIGAAPDFVFDTVTGEIDRAPMQWVDGDTVIGWYQPPAS